MHGFAALICCKSGDEVRDGHCEILLARLT
jgi:hypothetical protein